MDSPFERGFPHDGAEVFHGEDRTSPDYGQAPEYEAQWSEGGRYDGECCALVRLADGRYAAWESWWGATGSGFMEDAYGGGAEIHIGPRADVIRFGLSDEARERLGLAGEVE